ncbi:ABC-three component system middle component 2 [Aliarcobacter cryaerophilus]|jgi:hypothetical protein|uniref:ABC-three component system middle component 2 n=1 Tax=Aliarcobacter cryaerophilus TaxID=28198 RepID=UPI00082D86D9|nr:ABC-three component system middle component 2 [Aliarcobacter cryaerophilus]
MNKEYVFNNPIETGLRSLIILNAAYPKPLDLQQLIYYDYLTVHTGDIKDGPESIHPALPNRTGELLVRRKIIERGLDLFVNKKFIERIFTQNGIEYQLSENSNMFLDMLEEEYTLSLKDKAYWVINKFIYWDSIKLKKFIEKNIDNWGGEFIYSDIEELIHE